MIAGRGSHHSTWYGRFSLPVDATGFWQIGPYRLWAQRTAHEWKVASVEDTDTPDRFSLAEAPSERREPPSGATVHRFAFQQSPEAVTLVPALADRPVIVSPQQPLHLPPQEQVTVFISTPVWVQLSLGDSAVALVDEPARRPTDTWFGPSPMRGELCYATRTAARINLDNLPPRPHRATSVVEIVNRATTTLSVEKLKIPVIHQSVYATKDGDLYTETVTLTHQEDGAMASVRLAKGPPAIAADAMLLNGPRMAMDTSLLIRAFGGLLG